MISDVTYSNSQGSFTSHQVPYYLILRVTKGFKILFKGIQFYEKYIVVYILI